MPASENHREWDGAFEDELTVVNTRRQKPAAAREGLVGLAISGGGIRSATFALGILESLRRVGILKQVDYLSTVSGGGYIGAWLSANCKRQAGWLEPDADWNESVRHLRRYSNYLSPQVGFFSADTWSMVTIWLRNTFLVQSTVILAIACALMVPRLLYEIFQHWPEVGSLRWITIFLFTLGAVGIAGNHWRLTASKPLPLLIGKKWLTGLGLALVLLAAAWAWARWWDFAPFRGGEIDALAAFPVALLLVVAGFCLQPVAVRVVAACWPGSDPPQQVNYTQNWAQAVVIIPLMAAAFLVAAILWGESLGLAGGKELAAIDSYSAFFLSGWRYWPFPLSVVFVSFWLFSFGGIRCRTTAGKIAASAAPFVAIPVLHGLLCAVMLLLHSWAAEPSGAGAWKAFTWGPPLVTLSFVQTIVVLIAMMGRDSIDDVREWWSRLGAWLGIYAVAWMVITVSAVYGPLLVAYALSSNPLTMLTAGGGWLGTVLGGLFAGKSGTTGGESVKSLTTKAKEVLAAVAPFAFIAGLLIMVAFVLDRVVTINSGQTWTSVGGSNWRHGDHAAFLSVSLAVFGACLTALLVLAARVDINEFSLNAFYRNRLVRCYLGATRFREGERNPQKFTGFDGADDVALAKLIERIPPLEECKPDGEAPAIARRLYGPLHIVNCALNLGGSGDLALHTRHSAVFTLSPLYSGSRYRSREQTGKATELGYVKTEAYGGLLGAPTLGQAIAVSGAAASPNMGYHTSPVVAFLLTLFNVRLGWWFPNPRWPEIATPTPRFSLRYLFAELFGGASDKSKFVMISDGGHFENLAAYELVRRQCRFIIISDGECDSMLAFEGLGSLIRMCEVDFGAKITLDVADIRATGTPGWSGKRWAVGRIEYGPGIPDGTLIYLKASMTGKEDTAIRQYKSAHAAFPHETTGDQFYGEDQFESYRRLGRELAADALSRPLDVETVPAAAARAVPAVTGV
jgi:hypothetical protein